MNPPVPGSPIGSPDPTALEAFIGLRKSDPNKEKTQRLPEPTGNRVLQRGSFYSPDVQKMQIWGLILTFASFWDTFNFEM